MHSDINLPQKSLNQTVMSSSMNDDDLHIITNVDQNEPEPHSIISSNI